MEQRYIDLHEWHSAGPDSYPDLAGVAFGEAQSRAIASDLTKARMLSFQELRSGLHVQSTSFVGRVRVGGIVLTVKPKLGERELFGLLRYAYGLRDLHTLGDVTHDAHPDALQDLLVLQLVTEATELLSRGLHRRYLRTFGSLASPRGRIDMQRMADPRWRSSGSLPCSHFPRSENCLHNQVLAAGLQLGARIAQSTSLRTDCRRSASLIGDAIDAVPLTGDVLRRTQRASSRLTVAYRPATRIIELLMQGSGIALEKGPPTPVLPGFLFDMNRFFQVLLSRFLSENLPGYRVRDEHRILGMLSYVPGYNPQNRRSPHPRPDFVIEKQGQAIAVLDAKYRDLWEHALPRDMLYQLSIYALSQVGGDRATILYPTTSPTAREARIAVSDPCNGLKKGEVVLRPIVLQALHALVTAPESPETRRQRVRQAMHLAFGSGTK